MLRTPLAANTQATRGLRSAAVSSLGNGELITCSRVKRACSSGAMSRKPINEATAKARRRELVRCAGVIRNRTDYASGLRTGKSRGIGLTLELQIGVIPVPETELLRL